MVWIILALFLGGLVTAFFMLLKARREQARDAWLVGRRIVLLKILVPKNNEKTPLAAENLFAALHGIYRPDNRFHEYLSFEIAARAKAIEFYVQCPKDLRDFVEGQIYAQYPNIEIQEIADYARVDLAGLKLIGGELSLNKADVFPIKTFPNFEVDPLAGITSVLSNVGDREQIWIQTLMRPVSDSWQDRAISYATAARSGNLQRGSIFRILVRELLNVFRPPPPATTTGGGGGGEKKLPAPQDQAVKGIETKATKLGFAAKFRVVVLAPDAMTAQTKINALSGAYKQFNTTNMNGFSLGKTTTDPKIIEDYRLRAFGDEGAVFNIEELASVFHFPNVSVETPNIVWAGAKKGEPPATIPVEGTTATDELTLFGMTDFRGVRQKFGIKLKDRRQHMYAIGKSGTGKSTMLENMAIDDIRKGRGVAIVDPHGDFINHVLDAIPASRINDVIYFNPADKDYPIGFNILENVDPTLKNVVASGVVGIFEKIFGEKSWGPRLEYILRNVVLALLEYPNATMLSIMRVLVDKRYREKVIAKCKDPVIRDFFINEFEKYDPKFRTEAIAPIQNKVGQFLSASTIRNIVGQPKSTFDIEEVMNTGKILLLDLSIGKIGEDAAALLGSMMITKVQLAAMRRTDILEDERRDFYLYVDEFQNFATESFAVILSEARKYRLNIILTHQYIAQMPEPVAKAVFGNVGTLISFRVGASDAVALVKEYEPVFEANDLINLDNHHIYVKMSIDGVTRPAFSAITLPPTADKNNNREKIIRVSREHYSRPREFVEQKIAGPTIEEDEDAALDHGDVAAPSASREDKPLSEETPKKGTKGPSSSVVTAVYEGMMYEGRQDKEGRHWYAVIGPAEAGEEGSGKAPEKDVKEVAETTKVAPLQPPTKPAGEKQNPSAVATKKVVNNPKTAPPKTKTQPNQPIGANQKPGLQEKHHQSKLLVAKPKAGPASVVTKVVPTAPADINVLQAGETVLLRD